MAIQLGQYEVLNIPEIPVRLQQLGEEFLPVYLVSKVRVLGATIALLPLSVGMGVPALFLTTAVSFSCDLIYFTHGNFETPLERMVYRVAVLGISFLLNAAVIGVLGGATAAAFSTAVIPASFISVLGIIGPSAYLIYCQDRIGSAVGEVFQ